MSYCRFSEGDVYLYGSEEGYVCAACRLQPLVRSIFTMGDPPFGNGQPCGVCRGVFDGCETCGVHGSLILQTAAECIAHLLSHQEAGHDFPEDALLELRKEVNANEARRASDNA